MKHQSTHGSSRAGCHAPGNEEIARCLERVAELLRGEESNPFRIRSYERAAATLRNLDRPVAELFREGGEPALRKLEHIGERIAASIRELIETGRLGLLERMEAGARPGQVFTRVPGIGPELGQRIEDELGIHTLEELEQAAHDGRLSRVDGMGTKRVQGVRDALAGMLARGGRRQPLRRETNHEPPVGTLLAVDREYRRRAAAGELRRIAPRRFNPSGERWLPVMTVRRDGWAFTALFSNTARAHELGRTHDWVVIYFRRDHEERQCTVVTAYRGPLAGQRVVRGRERECRQYDQAAS